MNKIDAEKEKLEMMKKKIQLQEKILKEKEKRQRALRFEEIGRIAVKANIDSLDENTILGAFLEISEKINERKTIEDWKRRAEKFLTVAEKTDDSPISISFKNDPSTEIKNKLKDANFKWNRFRKEYYGFGNKSELETLFKETESTIEVLN